MTIATPREVPIPAPPPKPAPPVSAPVRITGAQALVRALEEVGCEAVFGIPGGTILPAYDPLLDSTRVRHVLV
ncbi:MAG: thiamine pyrophosphate-binding protein, partial [Pseudonocardiaceae bacterium]